MKKNTLLIALGILFLLTSCQTSQPNNPALVPATPTGTNRNAVSNANKNVLSQNANQVVSNPNVNIAPAIADLENQPTPEVKKVERAEEKAKPATTTTKLYSGAWFDISYPDDFVARPTTPLQDGTDTVDTDEAFFASPDDAVEFFVYSPLWGGDPQNYLTAQPNEKIVSEKTDEKGEGEEKDVTRWVTFQATDSSYMRSYVSSKYNNGELHHVFGIKYKDAAAYEKYKAVYAAFKGSLTQYAD